MPDFNLRSVAIQFLPGSAATRQHARAVPAAGAEADDYFEAAIPLGHARGAEPVDPPRIETPNANAPGRPSPGVAMLDTLRQQRTFDEQGLAAAAEVLQRTPAVPRMPTRISAQKKTKLTLSGEDLWVTSSAIAASAVKKAKNRARLDWTKIDPAAFMSLDEGGKRTLVETVLNRGKFRMSWFESAGKGWHANLDAPAAMALWFCEHTEENEDITSEMLRLCNVESISTLSNFAGGIFTRDRVTVVLNRLLHNCHRIWDDPDSEAKQRQDSRSRLIEVGTGVVAAYYNNHKRFIHLKTQANDDAFKDEVQKNQAAVLEEMSKHPAAVSSSASIIAEALEAGKDVHSDMMAIYLSSLADFWGSPNIEKASLDLHTIFIAGGARWAAYAQKKGETRQKRATSGATLFFAIAGFIPIAGHFAGLVSWVANEGITRILSPYDGRQAFEKLHALWLLTIVSNYPRGMEVQASAMRSSQDDIYRIASASPWSRPNYGMWARLVSGATAMTKSTDHI